MIYVLIVLLWVGSGNPTVIAMQEFSTKVTCEAAAEAIKAMHENGWNRKALTACVVK
jgi:hypothetical protein